MAETVLVTGGSGFIGGWCIVELLRRGYTVRTTLRSLNKVPAVCAAIQSQVDPDGRLSFVAAELTGDKGWDEAVAGCDYVLHVASPLGTEDTKDADELIVPARDGALRVLAASVKAGVKRVVLTSSVAAVGGAGTDEIRDETEWTDLTQPKVHPYRQSKTIAEKAAWDFIALHPGKTELVTILPCVVLGPVLTRDNLGSVQVVSRLVDGKLPGTPRLGFTIVDVRDVAEAHILAMTLPEAAGERFIVAAGFRWMGEIAAVLRARLGTRASKVPTRKLPDFVPRIMAIFDPALRYVTPGLGKRNSWSAEKAKRMLGWAPRDIDDTIAATGESLLAAGPR